MSFSRIAASTIASVGLAFAAHAQGTAEGGQVGEMTISENDMGSPPAASFSPYAGRAFPTRPLWGDTHLHTSNSLDARAFGAVLSPTDAYSFARGDEVTTSHGLRVKLSRPPQSPFNYLIYISNYIILYYTSPTISPTITWNASE